MAEWGGFQWGQTQWGGGLPPELAQSGILAPNCPPGYDIYSFIIRSIRRADEKTELLKRFLYGPQNAWCATYRKILELDTLIDPLTIDADLLTHLADLLGYTSELDWITIPLSEREYRKLLFNAVRIWKTKGTERGLELIVGLTAATRFRIVNYFDYRLIIDQAWLGYDFDRGDPWLLDLELTRPYASDLSVVLGVEILAVSEDTPEGKGALSFDSGATELEWQAPGSGSPGTAVSVVDYDDYDLDGGDGSTITVRCDPNHYTTVDKSDTVLITQPWADQFWTDIRVVDEGQVNRQFLKDMLSITRPPSERIFIAYIDFLDMFQTDGDKAQWESDGSPSATVADGYMTLANGSAERASTLLSDLWTDYTVALRFRLNSGDELELRFFWQDATNYYFVVCDVTNKQFILKRKVGGSDTTLGTVSYDFTLGAFHSIRVDAIWSVPASEAEIKTWMDGSELLQATDTNFSDGTIAVAADGGADIDIVELLQLPLETETVIPNQP